MLKPIHLQALLQTRTLLTDQNNWTQGACCRDSMGEVCSISAPEAISFCLFGGLFHELNEHGGALIGWPREILGLLAEEIEERGFDNVGAFNDSVDHATVLEALDRVLQKAIDIVLDQDALTTAPHAKSSPITV